MAEDLISVSIPSVLHKKIEAKIKDSEFSSVSSYVIKVLEDSLSREGPEGQNLSEEDEEKIKERLKALGYMD